MWGSSNTVKKMIAARDAMIAANGKGDKDAERVAALELIRLHRWTLKDGQYQTVSSTDIVVSLTSAFNRALTGLEFKSLTQKHLPANDARYATHFTVSVSKDEVRRYEAQHGIKNLLSGKGSFHSR